MAKRKIIGQPITVEPQKIPVIAPKIYLYDGEINPEAIRFFRHQHSMTQAMFGEFFDVSYKTVARWESGNYAPDHNNRDKLHQFCVATIRLLQKNDGIIPPNKRFRRLFEGGDAITFRELLNLLVTGKVEDAERLVAESESQIE